MALWEGPGALRERGIGASVRGGRLRGTKLACDGAAASLIVVAARAEDDAVALYLADARDSGVRREGIESIDPSQPWSRVHFEDVAVEPLGEGAQANWTAIERLLERAAVLTAFLQIGGADACLEAAREYALGRWAFGRPIAQYQAVKHRLVDIHAANELARSNAYFGAWALDGAAADLPMAGASARVSATEAFERAARDNMQTHGGIAATWAHDSHLYYRRSRHLATLLGSASEWRDRVATELERSVAP
jgi:alkylation response protein AidB-like acyl-CoA dehydrogenase